MAKRTSIYSKHFLHKNPVPAACRIGNLIFSGGIHGKDPQSGETARTLELQLQLTFANVASVIRDAGGDIDDIVKMTFWMVDRSHRPLLNFEWEKMFPDPQNRPTRHVMRGNLDGDMLVQCDFIAVVL
jgi:2-iminobutanoate/2-iminopropanoate deaminase